MKAIKPFLAAIFLLAFTSLVFSAPLYSPTWGFSLDLPDDYAYVDGDGKDRFSFETPDGAKFDLAVYYAAPGKAAPYATVEALAEDVHRRLDNNGDRDSFTYRQKNAWLLELDFSMPAGQRTRNMSGWALCLELGNNAGARPLLLAMAYGPAERSDLHIVHFSALDSIAPNAADRLAPGAITEFSWPGGRRVKAGVFALGLEAWIYEEDAEAAQAVVDREFQVLRRYADGPLWQEAWIRFYRAIYRDSFERLTDIAFQVERKLNVPSRENRDFADQALRWVQSFLYERDLQGSDFVNAVTAAIEGRGDCDSRALLWAIILRQANIPSAIMVSRQFSHAMGLADLPGPGARFETEGRRLLVAETTADVSIGLIGETVSDTAGWLGITFE